MFVVNVCHLFRLITSEIDIIKGKSWSFGKRKILNNPEVQPKVSFLRRKVTLWRSTWVNPSINDFSLYHLAEVGKILLSCS